MIMEFNEKLQELRKQKGLTQEELAQALYVSRTAISKWESARGYPSIDSLKEIARYFSVTIDELLSSNEMLCIAEEDNKQKEKQNRSLLFGLLDVCVLTLFFLPLFGQNINGTVSESSLLYLTEFPLYLKIIYFAVVISVVVYGIITLALQNCQNAFWVKNRDKISLILNVVAVLLFIISSQPYAAALLFLFLLIKAEMLIKWQ